MRFFFSFFRLLVGAPEADSGQPGVVKGGAVFKCPPEAPGSCDLIQFDTKVSFSKHLIWPQILGSTRCHQGWRLSKIISCILMHMKNDDPKRTSVLFLSCKIFTSCRVFVLKTPLKKFSKTFPITLTIKANLIRSIFIVSGKYSSSYGTAI